MQKRVLFLGGAYAQVPIIQEAKDRGWYIITCDYLPGNPGHKLADEYYNVSTTDFQGVLELAKKVNPDFVIAYASDPAAPTAAYVSDKLGLPGNTYNSVKLLSEKDLFRKFLKDNGFNTPNAISVDRDLQLTDLERLEYPQIVKPTDSSGSKGVTRVENNGDIEAAISYALNFSRNKRVIIEEFIESHGCQLHGDGFVENGELVFLHLGEHHYNININPFVPYSTTWPNTRLDNEIELVKKELSKAIMLSGFKNGAVNIEVRTKDSGDIYIMEIGPRSGGNFVPQVINYCTGYNMVEAILKNLNGEVVKPQIPLNNNPSAYYVIHSSKDGELEFLNINEELKPFINEFHQYIPLGANVRSFQGANAAIGILLLTFTSVKEMKYYITNMEDFVQIIIK